MTTTISTSLRAISHELAQASKGVASDDHAALVTLVADAPRIFVHAAGRSRLAVQMTAMRLMHLGATVHVVGEATAPAIARGDVLLVASGSGTTGSVVTAARTALDVGARVAAITTASDSPLADLAEVTVLVPAAGKLDRSGVASAQYAGSLFEQAVVLVGDALFDTLWLRSEQSADDLWPRHSNLE